MENKYKCLEVDDSEIYRLRYQVYVQEKKFIDKDNKKFIKDNMVTDDIDKVSHQLAYITKINWWQLQDIIVMSILK